MGEQKIITYKVEKSIRLIRNILYNREIETDEEWWKNPVTRKCIEQLVSADGMLFYHSHDLKLDMDSNEVFLFAAVKGKEEREAFLEKAEESLLRYYDETGKEDTIINLVCFVNHMKARMRTERFLDAAGKMRLQKAAADRFGKNRQKVKVNYLNILDNDYTKKEIVIKNIDRFNMLQMPPIDGRINIETEQKKTGMTGYLLSVDLMELIEMYNLIGDTLFDRNVRYGISEQLGVDRAIKDTLKREPEKFWFRNNGITIVIDREDFKLDRVSEILLKTGDGSEKLGFSVINGAQTITASAEYYYSLECDLEDCIESKKKDIQNAIDELKKVKVLLRIIYVTKDSTESSREMNEISVALNRQKPIKIEDIAYTSEFVEQLAGYLDTKEKELGKNYFTLVKRGESGSAKNSMDLVEFARARMACAGRPGDARSKGAKTLLAQDKKREDGYHFADKNVFFEEELEKEGMDVLFPRRYRAVNFASQLAHLYEKKVNGVMEGLEQDDRKRIILSNGKWYFVSYLTGLLNEPGGSFGDYTNFQRTIDDVSADMEVLMSRFAVRVQGIVENNAEYKVLDSNVFKKDELFKLICEELDKDTFLGLVQKVLRNDTGKNARKETPPAGSKMQMPRINELLEKKVVEAGDEIVAKDTKEEAVLLSNGNVFTKDGEMSLNQWLRKVLGWSTVDTYNYSVHKKTGKTLKALRDEYMKDRE